MNSPRYNYNDEAKDIFVYELGMERKLELNYK
jgi:hypothetical protein